jgi:hypothetical protein
MVRGYFIVVMIFVYLMISNIEHFFMYLLVICLSSFEECLFKPMPILIGLFVCIRFGYCVFEVPYFLDINPLFDV